MRQPIYAKRRPKIAGERVTMKREGNGFWHARADDGELVAIDQWQNDLEPGLKGDGFTVMKIGN